MFSQLACVVLLAAAASAGIATSGTSISSRQQDDYGNYAFNYDIVDGIGAQNGRWETGDAWGNKRGAYTITDIDGRARRVEYVADAAGFRAVVKTNEPGTAASAPAAAVIASPYAGPAMVATKTLALAAAPAYVAPVAVAAPLAYAKASPIYAAVPKAAYAAAPLYAASAYAAPVAVAKAPVYADAHYAAPYGGGYAAPYAAATAYKAPVYAAPAYKTSAYGGYGHGAYGHGGPYGYY